MEIRVGKVTHYYDRISVAVLELTGELKIGDTIRIFGRATDYVQRVRSMEIDHQKIQSAGPGTEVAMKVINTVRKRDIIYKLPEEHAAEA